MARLSRPHFLTCLAGHVWVLLGFSMLPSVSGAEGGLVHSGMLVRTSVSFVSSGACLVVLVFYSSPVDA